ncbi:hypothetical protein Glove_99g358 [Diversispora epigaea]|uniref:Protein kinase domain-containing protein n=1 Tax=Diversispora epigaea TaxID=1348612 RepID=A0A397JDP8_9GLOM|nr:hypothetical protein Glove_99g358 [Diversispora epigaea]
MGNFQSNAQRQNKLCVADHTEKIVKLLRSFSYDRELCKAQLKLVKHKKQNKDIDIIIFIKNLFSFFKLFSKDELTDAEYAELEELVKKYSIVQHELKSEVAKWKEHNKVETDVTLFGDSNNGFEDFLLHNIQKTRQPDIHFTELELEYIDKQPKELIHHRNVVMKKMHSQPMCEKNVIRPSKNLREKALALKEEVNVLNQLKICVNILGVHGCNYRHGYFVITEWAENFDLQTYLRKNPGLGLNKRIEIAYGIANALNHCHQESILHQDVRSHNILLDKDLNAKLANIRINGSSSIIKSRDDEQSFRWAAPELLNDSKAKYTSHCDVYSFAMVLYEIATGGKMPLEEIESDDVFKRSICEDKRPDLNLITNVSAEYKEIMIKGWASNPQDRPTITQMFEVLDKLHYETKNIIIDTTFSSDPTSAPPLPSTTIENKSQYLSPNASLYRKRSNSSISRNSMYSNSSSSRSELPSLIPRYSRSSSRSSFNSSISSEDYDGYDYMNVSAETDPSDKFCEENLVFSDHGRSKRRSEHLEHFQFRKRTLKNNEILGDLNIAYRYEKSEKLGKHHQAFEIFKQHAELGSVEAQFKAGELLKRNKFKLDSSKARSFAAGYFREAAKQGSRDAQYEYGKYIICRSKKTPSEDKEKAEALNFLIEATNQKSIKAMELYNNLLSKDAHRYGFEPDPIKSRKLKELIAKEKIKQCKV